MTAVVSYNDPQISSFKIFESRNQMKHTLGLTDHGMRIFFCISDQQGLPTVLDRRYGRFELISSIWGYSFEDSFFHEMIDVGVREVDFLAEEVGFEAFSNKPIRGIMTARDDSLIQLHGTLDTESAQII